MVDSGESRGRDRAPPLGWVVKTIVTAAMVVLAVVIAMTATPTMLAVLPALTVAVAMAVGYAARMVLPLAWSLDVHLVTWAVASTVVLVTVLLPMEAPLVVTLAVAAMVAALAAASVSARLASRGDEAVEALGEGDDDSRRTRRRLMMLLLTGAALALYICVLVALAWAIPRLNSLGRRPLTARVCLALFGMYPVAYALLGSQRDGVLAVLDLSLVAGFWLTTRRPRICFPVPTQQTVLSQTSPPLTWHPVLPVHSAPVHPSPGPAPA